MGHAATVCPSSWEWSSDRSASSRSGCPRKPIRIWMEVGDRDLLITRDNYHHWVLANENMAKVLPATINLYSPATAATPTVR